jgi:UDP-N-acetylglucosamine--N-acetylmuramyl-(pentapeptide) pyrophosphoryl-undecaprenol N-acetylglucosamine transferase
MRIIITAGGGGHFSPALAVMKQLPRGTDVLFIGRKYAFEADKTLSFEYITVRELGIPYKTITTGRLQRRFSLSGLFSLAKTPVGLTQSLRILHDFRPDVVFSTGGYIALPVTIAARLLRIPVVIHEQTMRAGLANRIAGKFAAKICISWEKSAAYFPENRVVLTGNPIREAFFNETKQKELFQEKLPIIFITGGSLGAHTINSLIESILGKLVQQANVLHQTGDAKEYGDYDRLVKRKAALPDKFRERYTVTKFISPDEIAGVFREATLIVSRAGINTVSEIIFFEKPALLIPLPHGQQNEQIENADYLKSLGLALVVPQETATPETVYTEIAEMLGNLKKYRLKQDLPEHLRKDAAAKIINTLFSVTKTPHAA